MNEYALDINNWIDDWHDPVKASTFKCFCNQCKWDYRLRVHDAEAFGIMPGMRQFYIDKGILTAVDFDIPLAEFEMRLVEEYENVE